MRFLFLLPTVLLCLAAPAFAQVTVNLDALNALPATGAPAAREPVARHSRPRPRSMQRRTAHLLPVPPIPPGDTAAAAVATAAPASTPATAPKALAAAPAHPPAAVVPPAPPPQVALAPLPPPAPAAAPPAPPPVTAQAASHATASPSGLTVSFGPDSADLSPASAAAVAALARSVPQNDSISFNVLAYARGQADDPSSARRLSLSRALAIRSALTAAGVSSTRIYLRALGAEAGSGPPDRADITVMGANAPAATAAATPSATSGGKQE